MSTFYGTAPNPDELKAGLSKIASNFAVKEIADPETGRIVKYLMFTPRVGISEEECFEATRELCELPGANDFVIMEDY